MMDKLGLGWETLHAANPRLVMCAISGYGQRNARSHRAGHDINYIAMAGVLEQNATVDGDVAVPNFQIGDLMGGTQAAVSGMLAALLGAQRSGQALRRHLDDARGLAPPRAGAHHARRHGPPAPCRARSALRRRALLRRPTAAPTGAAWQSARWR